MFVSCVFYNKIISTAVFLDCRMTAVTSRSEKSHYSISSWLQIWMDISHLFRAAFNISFERLSLAGGVKFTQWKPELMLFAQTKFEFQIGWTPHTAYNNLNLGFSIYDCI